MGKIDWEKEVGNTYSMLTVLEYVGFNKPKKVRLCLGVNAIVETRQ